METRIDQGTSRLQDWRLWLRSGFFLLFVVAPPLNIFRLDLTVGHFILFGHSWTLGLDPFLHGKAGIGNATLNLLARGFLPLFGGGFLFLWVAWRYGRLYCGWLCPHFSVVEAINALMRRAGGKPTLWDKAPLPERLPDGRVVRPNRSYWIVVAVAVVGFALLWSITLLTYLLPPAEVWHNLLTGQPTRNQALFVSIGTLAFTIEFLLARHLFCRFGCAVGLFQSLAWMANRNAMEVGFDAKRATLCGDCDSACDNACPMRLKPRAIKRKMFTCTQCARCITACEQVQTNNPDGSLLQWIDGDRGRGETSECETGRSRPLQPMETQQG